MLKGRTIRLTYIVPVLGDSDFDAKDASRSSVSSFSVVCAASCGQIGGFW